jgi:osomolarity two-component system sensor histidine kinase NIK1
LKILLVEDNPLNQKVIAFFLKNTNYTLYVACNGKEAIEKYSQTSFDLIIMDLILPDISGYQVTAVIRRLEKESGKKKSIPIIALTANTLDNDREKCIKSGMNDYMEKPVSSEQLIEMVDKYLKRH